MRRQFYHKGVPVPSGTPLTLEGVAYPWNWLDLASEEDLAAHNFTYEDIPPSAEEIAEEERKLSIVNDPTRQDLLTRLKSASAAQISTWVDNNVTDLASARNVIKMILKLIALDARD